jgi:beta-N-acetylhexosaminidase
MKKKILTKYILAATGLMLLAFTAVCSGGSAAKEALLVKSAKPEAAALARQLVSRMTPEEKVGQLMIVGIDGPDLCANDVELLTKLHVGGIIFYDKDMENKAQVKQLIEELQARADDKGLPLFMALDQEGGRVSRMQSSLYHAPAAADIAAGGNPQAAYDEAFKSAQSIKELGFNLNFAPVLDLDLSPGRSYGKDPETVIRFAGQAAQAYADAGLLFSFKHFPGIGKGTQDTHIGSSIVPSSKEQLLKEDYLPFKELLQKFPQDRFMVMIGHLKYTAFGNTQASITPAIVTDFLRKETGFTGLAITDDMTMGAINEAGTVDENVLKAFQAGMDILLVCHTQPPKLAAYNRLLKAVKDGTISQERLDASVVKVVTTKLKYLVPEDKWPAILEGNKQAIIK